MSRDGCKTINDVVISIRLLFIIFAILRCTYDILHDPRGRGEADFRGRRIGNGQTAGSIGRPVDYGPFAGRPADRLVNRSADVHGSDARHLDSRPAGGILATVACVFVMHRSCKRKLQRGCRGPDAGNHIFINVHSILRVLLS